MLRHHPELSAYVDTGPLQLPIHSQTLFVFVGRARVLVTGATRNDDGLVREEGGVVSGARNASNFQANGGAVCEAVPDHMATSNSASLQLPCLRCTCAADSSVFTFPECVIARRTAGLKSRLAINLVQTSW